MTYNVFGGTLSLSALLNQSINLHSVFLPSNFIVCRLITNSFCRRYSADYTIYFSGESRREMGGQFHLQFGI